jgi:hypothetical protein
MQCLNHDALDLIKRNLILPSVVKLRGSRALVVGDVLRGFKGALVLQVRGDAGRPGGVIPDPGRDVLRCSPFAFAVVFILLRQTGYHFYFRQCGGGENLLANVGWRLSESRSK